ncbi:MAG: ATP-binding protein [Phaeodactylibacter sp.]|nr:ATP-binding protein [Phaeodactylibacter sp.]
MLTELAIINYRPFQSLQLEGLRRVNLIAGKNNTGKTALLEALRILAAEGDNTVINHILKQRGEFTLARPSSYDGLFNRKGLDRENDKPYAKIKLNELTINKSTGKHGDAQYQVTGPGGQKANLGANITPDHPNDRAVYVPFMGNSLPLEGLWENIVLTELEDDVVKILQQTVEPTLVRLDVKEYQTKVRLKDIPNPIPLQSLGDGVRRILTLALALVNAKGKILLIDEFEAGLHYSVQEKMWELVFDYAKQWDIQVFATTHSEDTLRAFYYVASRPENKEEAFFLRLQFSLEGKIEAILYPTGRLESAMELNLEIR